MDLALLIKTSNKNNQSEVDFAMEVFESKLNANTVLKRRRNIEEGGNKFYLIFTYKCDPSLVTKLKGTKG